MKTFICIVIVAAFIAGIAAYKHRQKIKLAAEKEAQAGKNFLQREEERLREKI